MNFDTKIAIIVREDLQIWQKLNVTAFVMSGIAGIGLRGNKKDIDKVLKGLKLHP